MAMMDCWVRTVTTLVEISFLLCLSYTGICFLVQNDDAGNSRSTVPSGTSSNRRHLKEIDSILNIGDSYNTGVGTLLQADGIPAYKFADHYGGTIVDYASNGNQKLADIHSQVEQANHDNSDEANSKWQDSLILMTGGGNDVSSPEGLTWAEVTLECFYDFGLVSLLFGCQTKPEFQIDDFNWDEVKTKYREFFESMAEIAGNARFRVMGYGRLFTSSWRPWMGCQRFFPLIVTSEANLIDDGVDILNRMAKEAIAEVKGNHPTFDIEFIDVTSFLTNGACTNSDDQRHIVGGEVIWDGVPYLCLLFNTECLSLDRDEGALLHPTQLGFDQYFAALLENLGIS